MRSGEDLREQMSPSPTTPLALTPRSRKSRSCAQNVATLLPPKAGRAFLCNNLMPRFVDRRRQKLQQH